MNYSDAPFRAFMPRTGAASMLNWDREEITGWIERLVKVLHPQWGEWFCASSTNGVQIKELLERADARSWDVCVSPRYGSNEGVVIDASIVHDKGIIHLMSTKDLRECLGPAYEVAKTIYLGLFLGLSHQQRPVLTELAVKVPLSNAYGGFMKGPPATGGEIHFVEVADGISLRCANGAEFHKHPQEWIDRIWSPMNKVDALAWDWEIVSRAYGLQFKRHQLVYEQKVAA